LSITRRWAVSISCSRARGSPAGWESARVEFPLVGAASGVTGNVGMLPELPDDDLL
jgi:hypothetical protein